MLNVHQLKQLLDLILNQTAKLRKGGTELVYFCPYCNHHKRKLEICIDKSNKYFGIFNCWTCSTSGNLYVLLKTKNAHATDYEKLNVIINSITQTNRKNKPTLKEFSTLSLPAEFQSLAVRKISPEYKNALAYVTRRGVTQDDILRYNIGYCESGDYAYHIIIPSYDAKGTLNFFMGRRYYITEGVIPHKKPECSMNIIGFESFVNYDEPLNLVEGVFDAIAVRNNAIPLFGKHISSKLRESMISNGTTRVNMILDTDAMEDSIKNCQTIIRLGIDVHLIKLNKKDPSILGFNNIHPLIRNSTPFEFDDLLEYNLGKI